jgi:AP endonuclease-2
MCIQEVKSSNTGLDNDMIQVPGYLSFYSFGRKGYAGVATFVKESLVPLSAQSNFSTGIDLDIVNSQGRCVITDHSHFVLLNVYFPHADSLERLEFKQTFSKAIQHQVDILLNQKRNVVLAGDVNVAHFEIDHCNPKQSCLDWSLSNFADFAPRQWLDQFILPNGYMVDLFRKFHPTETGAFTVWNTLINARPANYGTRIDYILCNQELAPLFTDCFHLPNVMGSDHCPVVAVFDDSIRNLLQNSGKPPLLCTCYWDNYPGKQKRLSSYFKPITHRPSAQQTTESYISNTTPSLRVSAKKNIKKTNQPSILKFVKSETITEENESANAKLSPNETTIIDF